VKTTHRTGSDCDNGWINSFEYTVSDACGNVYPPFKIIYQGSDQSAPVLDVPNKTYTVKMSEYPGIGCPADVDLGLTEGQTLTQNETFPLFGYFGGQGFYFAEGTDNCTAAADIKFNILTITESGDTCSKSFTVEYTAEDNCGNTTEVYTKVYTLVDDVAPVIDCPDTSFDFNNEGDLSNTIDLGLDLPIAGYAGGDPTWPVPVALYNTLSVSDNCAGALQSTVVASQSQLWRYVAVEQVPGGYIRTFLARMHHTANDGCGNTAAPCDVWYTFKYFFPDVTRTGGGEAIDITTAEIGEQASSSNGDSEMSFRAYPVPFNGEVTIAYNFNFDTDVTVEVYDTKGMLVLSKEASYLRGTDATMPLAINGSDQMYYVKVITNQGTMTKKVVATSGN
jgi:hypothetical protein